MDETGESSYSSEDEPVMPVIHVPVIPKAPTFKASNQQKPGTSGNYLMKLIPYIMIYLMRNIDTIFLI